MMRILHTINQVLINGLIKNVFDHLRNILICALLLAIGTDQLQSQSEMFFSFAPSRYGGIGVIAISFILVAINTYDGVRMLCMTKLHKALIIPVILVYLFLTAKILEMAWNFRITF